MPIPERWKGATPGPWLAIDTSFYGDPTIGPNKNAIVGPPQNPKDKPYPTDSSERVMDFELPIYNSANSALLADAHYLPRLVDTLESLVRQIDLGNAVDDHGHELKNLKALYDAKALCAEIQKGPQ